MSTPTRTRGPEAPVGAPAVAGRAGFDRAGLYAATGILARAVLRRDRIRIAVWVLGIVVIALASAASVKAVYPTQADLEAGAAPISGNAAVIAVNGPDQGLDTYGGRVVFEIGTYTAVAVALMSAFMVGRNTRGEEESGRTEMVRAAAVGRHAPTTAALLVVAAMNVVVGVGMAVGLWAQDLPAGGAWTFGLGLTALGLFFAGVTAVVAQVTQHTRAVYGGVGVAVAVAYVLRAVGDVGNGVLSWLSPIGWMQAMRPYAGERLWPVLLLVAGAGLLVAWGFALESRRDLGAGLVAPRAGPGRGTAWLGHPVGFALRLQRSSLIAWTAGIGLLGAVYGSLTQDIEDFITDNEAMADIIARSGDASLVDMFLATTLLMIALIAGGFAVQSTLRLRGEETAGRAEALLATPVSRVRWAGSHLVMAGVGSVVVMAAGGFGMGLAHAMASDDWSEVLRVAGAAVAHVPALWVLVGVATMLFGWVPRAAMLAWLAVAATFLVGILADLLELPTWVRNLSPYEHVPDMPAQPWAVGPTLVLVIVAAALTTLGLVGFRRRDIGAHG